MSQASASETEGRCRGQALRERDDFGVSAASALPPRRERANQKPTSKKRVTAGIDSKAVPASQIQSETSVVVLAPENRS